jgi:hypothetical protein
MPAKAGIRKELGPGSRSNVGNVPFVKNFRLMLCKDGNYLSDHATRICQASDRSQRLSRLMFFAPDDSAGTGLARIGVKIGDSKARLVTPSVARG